MRSQNVRVNPKTGNQEIDFHGKLLSISDQVLNNVNNTEYRVGTIRFENAQGEEVDRSCLVYESNYQYGMEADPNGEGPTYLCRAINGEEGILLICSHLTGATRAQASDFSFAEALVEEDGSSFAG